MANQEELKPLKALYIVGSDIYAPVDVKTLFNNRKDDCLIIGDSSAAITVEGIKSILKDKKFKITKDTRIDIKAHGKRADDKQHKIYNTISSENTLPTKQLFQDLKEIAKCPLYVHLWSCDSGSANKAASELGTDSILVTHVESKSSSSAQLGDYSMMASLECYLKEDLTPYQQFILDFSENFQAATFNKVGTNDTIDKFKFTRMRTSKDKKMADILKNLSEKDDLTDYFNVFLKTKEKDLKRNLKLQMLQMQSTL